MVTHHICTNNQVQNAFIIVYLIEIMHNSAAKKAGRQTKTSIEAGYAPVASAQSTDDSAKEIVRHISSDPNLGNYELISASPPPRVHQAQSPFVGSSPLHLQSRKLAVAGDKSLQAIAELSAAVLNSSNDTDAFVGLQAQAKLLRATFQRNEPFINPAIHGQVELAVQGAQPHLEGPLPGGDSLQDRIRLSTELFHTIEQNKREMLHFQKQAEQERLAMQRQLEDSQALIREQSHLIQQIRPGSRQSQPIVISQSEASHHREPIWVHSSQSRSAEAAHSQQRQSPQDNTAGDANTSSRQPPVPSSSLAPSGGRNPGRLRFTPEGEAMYQQLHHGEVELMNPLDADANVDLILQLQEAAYETFGVKLDAEMALNTLEVSRHLPDAHGWPTAAGALNMLRIRTTTSAEIDEHSAQLIALNRVRKIALTILWRAMQQAISRAKALTAQ